ncbi:hypothetical protein PsorP6_004979 [Peronosclerospora sorghi]|uniref:Uncharacterized protein n=1 Tax=Peronosclerospora sorghi TaxID=230839 RepID=A0ACC0W3U9_9STRA|nr:hypothetical protein PsorP6_004979 [Peronosclerospora sorghi]
MLHHSAPWEREKNKPRQPRLGAQYLSHGKCQASFVTPSPPVVALLSALTVDKDVAVRSSLMQSMCQWLQTLKPSMNKWRERAPNKSEPILLWDDILTWRSHMFQVIKATFSWSDAQVIACMHDDVTKPFARLVELWNLALVQQNQQQLKVSLRDKVRFSIAADGSVVLTVLKGVPFEDDAIKNHVGTLESFHRDGTVASNVATWPNVSS